MIRPEFAYWSWTPLQTALAELDGRVTDPAVQAVLVNRAKGFTPPANVADVIQARRDIEGHPA